MDGSRSALIVANDSYSDPGLSRLRAPDSDAQALAGVLRDPGIGDFDVRVLVNEPAHEVNLAVEESFADRRPEERVDEGSFDIGRTSILLCGLTLLPLLVVGVLYARTEQASPSDPAAPA